MSPEETRAEKIRERIVKSLSATHPDQDVKVMVGPVPYGNFLWDDRTRSHISMTTNDVYKAVGFSIALEEYLRTIPVVDFDKSLLKA